MTLHLQPVTLKDARRFVDRHHRHHRAPQGGLFAIALNNGADVIGVVIIGRPVARHMQDGWTAEVTRLAVLEDNKNAASKLYGAAARACRALGYRRLLTYTLEREPGTSLVAAGWRILWVTADHPKGWDAPSRPRTVSAPVGAKTLWEAPI